MERNERGKEEATAAACKKKNEIRRCLCLSNRHIKNQANIEGEEKKK